MKPFLIIQMRPEAQASDDEFRAFLAKSGLREDQVERLRLEVNSPPEGLDLASYSGVILGGGPGCVSDDPTTRNPLEARMEADMLRLMRPIVAQDFPFLGCCYGIGILGASIGADVSKAQYGEPVGPVACTITEAGRTDALLAGVTPEFNAFVGHKEALQSLPPDSVHLVSAGPCPFQMLRHKQNLYVTQFHPEADGEVFATRIRLYKDKGYFHPDEAEALIDRCMAAHVDQPEVILRNFVAKYGV